MCVGCKRRLSNACPAAVAVSWLLMLVTSKNNPEPGSPVLEEKPVFLRS